MYEDRPERDTPPHINRDLVEYGGLSPDGQPIWRVVLAQNCRTLCFGPMNHIEQGRIDAITDTTRPTDITPDRISDGPVWIPRYKVKGWILERWFPAGAWGTRDSWESQRARDDRTRLLAAYPQRGGYMMMCGPWKTVAEIGDLHSAIRCYNAQQAANPVNWDNHTRAWLALEAEERQRTADEFEDNIDSDYRMAISSILRTVSPSAQAFRDAVSQMSAGGTQLGASEKWG
jgi:hypothetical protein